MTMPHESLTRADIEREARAFLVRAAGEGAIHDREAFEAIVQREIDLTMRQRRAIARAQGEPA